jgi:hypothetical protein
MVSPFRPPGFAHPNINRLDVADLGGWFRVNITCFGHQGQRSHGVDYKIIKLGS